MRKAVIIADDLSGANDAGCKVFENGFKCVTLDASIKDLRSILDGFKGIAVINTASRLLAPAAAYKTVYSAVSALNTCGFIFIKTIWKKINKITSTVSFHGFCNENQDCRR